MKSIMSFISMFLDEHRVLSIDDYNRLLVVIGHQMMTEPHVINIQKLGQALCDFGTKYIQIPSQTIELEYNLPFKREFAKDYIKMPCQGIVSSGSNKGAICGRLTNGPYCGYHAPKSSSDPIIPDIPNISSTSSNVSITNIGADTNAASNLRFCTRILYSGEGVGLPCAQALKPGMTCCGCHGEDTRTLAHSYIVRRDKIYSECEQVRVLGGWSVEDIAVLRNYGLYQHLYNSDNTFNAEESYNQTLVDLSNFIAKIKTMTHDQYKLVLDLRTLNKNPKNNTLEHHKEILRLARKYHRDTEKKFNLWNNTLRVLPLKNIELLQPRLLLDPLDEIITNQQTIIKSYK